MTEHPNYKEFVVWKVSLATLIGVYYWSGGWWLVVVGQEWVQCSLVRNLKGRKHGFGASREQVWRMVVFKRRGRSEVNARRVYLERSADIHQNERGSADGLLEGAASGGGAGDRVSQ